MGLTGSHIVRIVAWNIRAGGGRRVDRIAETIERLGADVVAGLAGVFHKTGRLFHKFHDSTP